MMKTVRQLKTVSLERLKAHVLALPLKQWLPQRKSRLGRKGYAPYKLFLAFLLKLRENILYDTVLEQKLHENQTYRLFCDLIPAQIPSHDTLSRFQRKLTVRRLDTLFKRLDARLAEHGVFDRDEIALDATDILSNTRNWHHPDPEAGYGYKSDGERFHGYWAVFAAGTTSELVRAVRVTPANRHQTKTAQELFTQLSTQNLRNASLFLADSAYDDKQTYHAAITLGMVPLIAYNPKKSKTKLFQHLKRRNWRKRSLGEEGIHLREQFGCLRSAVERYHTMVKDLLKGRGVPVQGLYKVQQYIYGLSILTQLYGLVNWHLQQRLSFRRQLKLWNFL